MHCKTNTCFAGKFIFTFLLLLAVAAAQAQYNTSIGIRIGGTSGLTVKHFYRPTMAWEGIIGTFGNGFSMTALMEKHLPVHDAVGLFVFYGGGAHLAFYNDRYATAHFGREIDYRQDNAVGFGINGIVGVEYRLPDNIPLAVSVDLKPFLELGSGGYLSVAADPSIGIKFIFR